MVDFAATQAVLAVTTNGTPLPNVPVNARGVVLYIPPGGSVSYAVASSQPGSAPTAAAVAGNASGGATAVIIEPLEPGQNLYITAVTGSVLFRWLTGG